MLGKSSTVCTHDMNQKIGKLTKASIYTVFFDNKTLRLMDKTTNKIDFIVHIVVIVAETYIYSQ